MFVWVAAAWAGDEVVLQAPVLRIDAPLALVEIVADPARTDLAIEVDRLRWSEHCALTTAVEGGEAVVRVVRSGGPLRFCRVSVDARVPPATVVSADVGGGDVRLGGVGVSSVKIGVGDLVLSGVSGRLDADVTTGDVVGSFLGESVRARVGSGAVRLAGLSCPADVDVAIGKVELAYDRAPVGEIAIAAAAGKATVILPAGTAVALGESDARLGRLINELAVDPASPTVLRAGTHAGNVEILSGPPAPPPAPRSDP